MTTFSDQTLDLGRIRAIPKALTLPEPVEPAPAPAAPVESSAADTLDTYIRQNRAVTPRSVTEMRKVPRASIEEINDTDFEELRSRMLALGDRDTRSPAMKFLDLIDAPRNVIMSVLNSDLRKKAEAEGNTGTFGLGRVQFSDLLRSAGVNNRVAAGVLGFVGDVAFDPLTYIGPAGWGAKIGTTTKAGRAVSVGLRRTGKTVLDRQIARLAAGGAEVVDEAAHGYLAAKAAQKGFTSPQEWITALAGKGKDAKGIRNEIARVVYGDPSKSALERVFRPLGGERTMERAAPAADDVGNFAYDFFRSDSATDAAGMAARKFVEKYGEGTGKALRFGKAKGGVGSQILHVPFLDQYTVQVSPFTAGAVRALDNARLAMRAGDAVSSAPGEVGRPFLNLADELVNDEQELVTISEAKVQAAADHAAARMSYPDDLPEMPPDPDLPPSTDPVPPPGPTPIVPGGLEIPPDAPARTSNYIVGDFVQPQPVKPVQGRIDFDVEGRAQEILDAGDAVEMDEALDMARMEQAALERQAAESAGAGVPPSTIGTTQEAGNAIEEGRQEGRKGLLSPDSATTTPPAVDEAAGGVARAKEPWEMTYTELSKAIDPDNADSLQAARPLLATVFPEYVGAPKPGHADPWNIGRAIERGDELPRVPKVDLSQRHRRLILKAIEDGRTVPPQVLAEYPGLVKPITHRERVLGEARVAFSNVPPEQHDAWAALMDARAQTWAREGKGRTPDQFWEPIKVERGKAGDGQLYQDEIAAMAPVWYSKLSQVVNEKMGGSMDAAQLRATLQNNGVKPEELEWSRLGELKGKISKQQVLDHLAENAVQVKEVELSDTGATVVPHPNIEGKWALKLRDGSYVMNPNARTEASRIKVWDTREYARDYGRMAHSDDATKFSKYVLPGGEDYRELLLTLPEKQTRPPLELIQDKNGQFFARDANGHLEDLQTTYEPAAEKVLEHLNRERQIAGRFTASHFDEPNVLAHVRFNTRTDAQGKKVLFIEEIQSDWHQKGREKGYRPPLADQEAARAQMDRTRDRLRQIEARTAELDQQLVDGWRAQRRVAEESASPENRNLADQMNDVVRSPAGKMTPVLEQQSEHLRRLWGDKAAELDRLAQEELSARESIFATERKLADTVPDAPFKKTWHELAMKRMIRYASENGYDRVAWTTGAQQAERYDLSKQVSAILAKQNEDGTWKVGVRPNRQAAVGEDSGTFLTEVGGRDLSNVPAADLPDVVGKELAEKIVAKAGKPSLYDAHLYEGVDLRVGGEGMKGFYDQMLVTDTNKLIKRHGGRVGSVELASQDSAEGSWDVFNAHGFDITPSMKQEALSKGMPMFQRKRGTPLASLSFEQDGKAVMRAIKSPNITSLVHEASHLFLPGLADQDLKAVAGVYGVTPELLRVRSEQLPVAERTRWVRAHEHFARDFEKYAATGKAPTKELESVFAKLKDWFVAIYKKIIGTPLEREIDPRIRGVFDRMLGGVDDGSGLAVPSGKATRSMVWDRLKESVADTMEALNDGVVNTDDRLAEFSNATTFYKSIPTELKMALQRPGGEAIRRQFIRVEKLDPTKAGGEDAVVGAFGGDWDAYVEHLMDLAGSGRRKVLAAAEMNLNARPDVPFWRRLWDNWPGAGAKSDVVKMDDLDVPSAGPDVAFTVNGDEMRTMLDENGHLVVVYGDDAATVPAELVGTLPVDPGSVRRVTDEDLPDFNPDDPLFQRDVSGQGGLFGSRVGRISSGEQQGGLFGSAPEVPAPKTEIPTGDPERMLGESDAAYRERVALHRKWAESAKNTNTLFQDDMGGGQPNLIPTKTPRQIFDEQHAAAMEAMDKQYRETLGRIAEKRDRIVKELEAFDPKTAAPTVATLNDLLKLGEMRDNADSLLQLEMRRARTAKMAQAIDAADDPVFRSQEVGERLYNLVRNDPKAASDYADAITARMEALNAYRETIKATLSDIADADELEVASLAKSLLGTDDASIALSVFAAPARFLRDKFGENSAAFQYAEAMDRFWRRTFGVRRGTTTQLLTDISADMTARPISERMHAMSRMVDRVEAMKLPLEQADAMNLLHAYVYKHLGDTVLNGGAFAWKIGPDGQNLGDSEMVQLLKRAQDAGALTPANIQALKQAAAEHVDEMKRLGFSEQDYGVLGLLRPDYVYSPATKDAQQAMRLHAEAGSANPNVARAGPAFARARTLDQVRFPMQNPDDLLAPAEAETRWHRFFVGDMALADVPDDMLRPEQLTAKAAVVDYLKRVEEDPEFAAKFPPRPSDPMEINELAAQGRFQHVTGGAPLDKMKETDLSVVYGLRMGQHQHAMGMARLGEFLQRESFQIDPALFDQWERSPGKVLRLRGGTSARVVTNLKSNLDRAVSGVRIGDTVYRRLDSSLWSTGNNVLGNLFARMADGRGSKTPITLEHLLVHHAVADKIEDMLRMGEPKRFEELLHTADTLTGMWKQLTLMHPAWVVFNIVGDTANALAGGADPRTLVDAQRGRELMDVYRYRHNPEKLADIVVGLRDGREMTGTEFWNAVTNSRVVDNTLSSEAMLKIVEDNPGLLDAADRTMRKYTAPWFRANQSLQDWMRMMVFSSFLDQGVDTPIAAKRVLESIGDYSDFTKVEERFFRRVFPFYSWMRNNLGYQIMQLGQRPGYAALMPKLHTALEEATAGEAAVPENMRPGWMRDQLATQIGADPKSRISLMLGSALPSGDIASVAQGMFGREGAMKFLHYFTSNINPVITVPLQLGTGTEFFSGRSIGPDAYSGDTSVTDFAISQASGPLSEFGSKLPAAFSRSTEEGVARLAMRGRVQAFDEQRLSSGVRREFREQEQRIRSAVYRAQRDGDAELSAEARARLMQLYADALRRGMEDVVPDWAERQLAELTSRAG